jgi:hypothetical protein
MVVGITIQYAMQPLMLNSLIKIFIHDDHECKIIGAMTPQELLKYLKNEGDYTHTAISIYLETLILSVKVMLDRILVSIPTRNQIQRKRRRRRRRRTRRRRRRRRRRRQLQH